MIGALLEAPRPIVPSIGERGAAGAGNRWPEIAALFEDRARSRVFSPGSTLLLHGAGADDFFQVISGTVRCCTITEDGRRCIFRFGSPGQFLGFTDFERWHFTAEAIDRVSVLSVRREMVERVLLLKPSLQREVRRLVSHEFAAREEQLVMLSHAKADERLLWFLTEFGQRFDSEAFAHLPMSRQDIGDHLGMTFETVSRVFTALKRRGLIEMCGSNGYRVVGQSRRFAA